MTKLSERFKMYDESKPISVVEETPLIEVLLEKVNSVPYWNEYSLEEQCNMVRYFVKHSDIEDKKSAYETLMPYVTGFGVLQKLLDNEKVSAVIVNNDMSVYIEIGGNVFDTEIKLSQNMLQYILNYVKYAEKTAYIIDIKDDKNLTIRKI